MAGQNHGKGTVITADFRDGGEAEKWGFAVEKHRAWWLPGSSAPSRRSLLDLRKVKTIEQGNIMNGYG